MGVGAWPIHRHAQSLPEVFPLDAIVYLSPDAEEPLEVGLCLCFCLVLLISMCVCAGAVGGPHNTPAGRPNPTTKPHQNTQELDLHKVYVIGGIVDRSIVRGVTVKAARGLGVRTARLPLEHLNVCGSLSSRSNACACPWST